MSKDTVKSVGGILFPQSCGEISTCFNMFQHVSTYHVSWEIRYFLQDRVKVLMFALSCISTGNVWKDLGPIHRKPFLYALFIFLGRLGNPLCRVLYLWCFVKLLFVLSK